MIGPANQFALASHVRTLALRGLCDLVPAAACPAGQSPSAQAETRRKRRRKWNMSLRHTRDEIKMQMGDWNRSQQTRHRMRLKPNDARDLDIPVCRQS